MIGLVPSHLLSQSPSNRSLFIGDLSYFCTEADVADVFGNFGRVTNVEIKRGKFGDSLMHGFVELDTIDAAQRALTALNDAKFMGRRLR